MSYGSTLATVTFSGAARGQWKVEHQSTIAGDPLPTCRHILVEERALDGTGFKPAQPWMPTLFRLTGTVSHLRYTTGREKQVLGERGAPLGRPESRRAVLIPIRKSAEWWALPQDERRAIYEERSRHTSIGLEYLPRIARRLHHSRDLGEPFDFLTWFEFSPEDAPAFDELLGRLRASEEWQYVDREVEIRLIG